MKVRRYGLLAAMAAFTAGLVSCNLNTLSLSPTITFSVQDPYSSPQISIGYIIPTNGNIFASRASPDVLVTLEKHIAGTYLPVLQYESNMGNSGTLQFNLASVLSNPISASSYVPVDGTYLISMQVMSEGKPISGYFGQQTFTVDTSGGTPTITEVTPGLLSSSVLSRTVPIIVSGFHFSPTSTVAVASSAGNGAYGVVGTPVVKGSTEIDLNLSVSISSLTIPTALSITVSDASGASSPFVLSFDDSGMTLSSSVPPSASGAGNTNQIILVYGTGLSPFTTITMVDAAGRSIPVSESVLQGQSLVSTSGSVSYPITTSGMIPIYANLSVAAPGTATITATNPDGASATVPFTIH